MCVAYSDNIIVIMFYVIRRSVDDEQDGVD